MSHFFVLVLQAAYKIDCSWGYNQSVIVIMRGKKSEHQLDIIPLICSKLLDVLRGGSSNARLLQDVIDEVLQNQQFQSNTKERVLMNS